MYTCSAAQSQTSNPKEVTKKTPGLQCSVVVPARGCKNEAKLPEWIREMQKKRRHEKYIVKLPIVSDFFTVSVTKPLVSVSERQQEPAITAEVADSEPSGLAQQVAKSATSPVVAQNRNLVSPQPDSSSYVNDVGLDDDPSQWPTNVSDSKHCAILMRGPVQIQSDFPQNADGQRFTSKNYYTFMKNGEKINRPWLIS